ncbi:MAG: hypothetical protein LC789_16800 [Actinobacteria bacterium]|nr:hypothetical protein [Actinomycetota bacterium]
MTAARAWCSRWYAPLTYLLLALLGHLPAFRSLPTNTRCVCRDTPQTDWFLGWTPHALWAGHAPWTTRHLAAPEGVNLMWNTLLPLPGLLMAPVTAAGNVLVTHTLLSVLGFALSATSMWWVVRRWAPWGPARFAAGLLYGFSPYVVAQGTDHLNLQLVALPPLVLLCLDELLVRQRRRAVVGGLLLGLVALAQLLTTEEVLASTFIVSAVGLGVLVLQNRSRLDRPRVRHAGRGLLTAAGVLTVGAAWPLSIQLAGHRPVTGPVTDVSRFGADLLGPFVPGPHQLLGFDAIHSWGGGSTENGSYLGLPLVALLAVLSWRYRRVPVVRFASVTAMVVGVLSLGRTLAVAGTTYDIPLPFAAFQNVPLLQDLSAVRLSLYVALLTALLLAVGLDRLHAEGLLQPRRGLAVALLVAVPLLPQWPYHFERAGTPAFFTSGDVRKIPRDAVALTYPVPRFPSSEPMQWQALSGYRYRSVGGYLITPDESGRGTFRGGKTTWERITAQAAVGRGVQLYNPGSAMQLRLEMKRLDVRAVVIADRLGSDAVIELMTMILGRPGERTGGVTVWYL